MKILVVGLIVFRNNGVQLEDKNLDLINKFQDTFRKDNDTVIFPNRGPADNSLTDNP